MPTELPSLSTMSASTPGNGKVADPGLVAMAPGSGVIMIIPVSVCHQVSTTGQQIVAFVTLKGNVEATDDTTEVLREHVARKIGKLARPTTIIFTPDLPKTRSGKIMRRLLKDVAEERELGDVTTLADPAIVEEIRDKAAARPQED